MVENKRQAGAEVEITPAMIEAGVKAFDYANGRIAKIEDLDGNELPAFLEIIFIAMLSARAKTPRVRGHDLGGASV